MVKLTFGDFCPELVWHSSLKATGVPSYQWFQVRIIREQENEKSNLQGLVNKTNLGHILIFIAIKSESKDKVDCQLI